MRRRGLRAGALVTVTGRRRDDAGSGSVLLLVVALVVICASWAVMIIGAYVNAAHTASGAADLAAVDAARALERGASDGCPTAKTTAARNDARLTDCKTVADDTEYVVTVRVQVKVGIAIPGLPADVTASAEAGEVNP